MDRDANERLDAACDGRSVVAAATGLKAFVLWLVSIIWQRDADAVVSSTVAGQIVEDTG